MSGTNPKSAGSPGFIDVGELSFAQVQHDL